MRALVLSLIFVLLPSAAIASGPYIGLGVGSTQYKADLSALGGGSFDDSATGTKFYVGYGFNDYLSAELAYYNFAESSIGAIVINNSLVSAAVEAKGIAAYGVATYPASKEFKLGAKLGMLDWSADLRVNNATASSDGTDIAYGLFASYAFTKQLAVVAEWEKVESDNPELSLFSIGFRFDFK